MRCGLHFDFIKRILNEKIVDTKKYRYIVREHTHTGRRTGNTHTVPVIYRIPICELDTTAALWPGEWEKICSVCSGENLLKGGKMPC